MISHALIIATNELNNHLATVYNTPNQVDLGNLAEGMAPAIGGVPRDRIILSAINIKEEKTLKNLPNYVRDDVRMKVSYQNPPVFINLLVLVSATHSNYTSALSFLSRAIRFFQHQNVFTHDSVAPNSIADPRINILDRLETFKLIFDLYSPSLEEANHMWGTLGGKQYPSVIYLLRMLDLKFKAVQNESGLITEVVNDFYHKTQVEN